MANRERADGLQAFTALVEEFAPMAPRLRLSELIGELRSPVRVAVHGRSGVGRSTVSAVLRRRGVMIAPDGTRADVRLLVIAEGIKPEDRVMLATSDAPMLVVLNKADLTGSACGGAMANAHRRAADIHALTGLSTVPLVGLLARAAEGDLDGELVDALQTMVTVPADLTSVDAFTSGDHAVDCGVREQLLARLDRFGVAHAVVALARGAQPADLPDLFHEVSNVAAVLAELRRVAAPVRYRRVRRALAELSALAVEFDEPRVSDLLSSDAVVLARMTAAVEVVEAAGATVDARDATTAHLRRATAWRRYGRGPVNELHRHCSVDIVRGSLRLFDGAR